MSRGRGAATGLLSPVPPWSGAIMPHGCALKTPRETLIMKGLQTGRRH